MRITRRKEKNYFFSIVLCLLLVNPFSINAADQISVQGLLGKTAILKIDGKRRMVKVGKTSPEGVMVEKIEGETVTVVINGNRHSYKLGESSSFSTSFTKPINAEVIISASENGMYFTAGSINNHPVSLLVDTGANVIAMNESHATRLGIDFIATGQQALVATASDQVAAYRVNLDSVSIGQIQLHNIPAVVMQGTHPTTILLGMSFLNNLEIKRSGNKMILTKQW